ncbi:MAG: DUF349 domain-containing protein [Chlorobi bacterium]|nr:DUF349 domain-containing protein [Chlorobiota bacterium]
MDTKENMPEQTDVPQIENEKKEIVPHEPSDMTEVNADVKADEINYDPDTDADIIKETEVPAGSEEPKIGTKADNPEFPDVEPVKNTEISESVAENLELHSKKHDEVGKASPDPDEGEVNNGSDKPELAEHKDEPVADAGEEKEKKKKIKKKTSKEEDKKSSVKSDSSDVPEEEASAAEEEKVQDDLSVPDVDYTDFSPDALLNRLELLLSERPIHEIRTDVEQIKTNFYKKTRREIEEKRKRFLDQGGDPVDFKPEPHPGEEKLKELLQRYRDLKARHNRELEAEKKRNLEAKYAVIEEIKNLANRKESINKTFQDFRELQETWRSIGIVPQQYVKDLWDTYHHHVEKFYDYIKINKELRDLDLKKNLEKKLVLCEKAEQLLLEPDIINAFKQLQKYHDQWREIGPVPKENKEALWERFKTATTSINKKHQEHFQKLKETQRKNLEEKTALAVKAEDIARTDIKGHREWDKMTREILELQKLWKTIGFAPRKQNNAIYERFREACDLFFNRKREFYAENKEAQMNNLQLKTDLCIQAESLKDSTEWKRTTEDLIALQKKWKEIGPVPRKYSDQIWKRFRAACDTFFKNKSDFYASKEKNYSENLILKEKLIREIENYSPVEDADENFKVLNEFQRRWSEIGFVPFEKKIEIAEIYRGAINKLFNNLNIDEHQKSLLKYRNKLESLTGQSKARVKVEKDREKFINRIRQLESDITVWENNIGFFAQSDNVNSVIRDVQAKIDNAKASIRLLKDKIDMIDEMDL